MTNNLQEVYKIIQESLDDVEQLRLIQMLMTCTFDDPIPKIEESVTDGDGPDTWAIQAKSVLSQVMRIMNDDQIQKIGGQRVLRLLVENAPIQEIKRLMLAGSVDGTGWIGELIQPEEINT